MQVAEHHFRTRTHAYWFWFDLQQSKVAMIKYNSSVGGAKIGLDHAVFNIANIPYRLLLVIVKEAKVITYLNHLQEVIIWVYINK